VKKLISQSLLVLLLSAPLTMAQTIIFDDFSNPLVPKGTPDGGANGATFNGVDITGLTPANGSTAGNFVAGTNLPGGMWYENGTSPGGNGSTTGGNGDAQDGNAIEIGATLNLDGGGTVSSYAAVGFRRALGSLTLGSYNTLPILTISSYIRPESSQFGNSGDTTSPPDGALLGFNSAGGAADTNNYNDANPVGLLLDGSGGLTLVSAGLETGSTIAYSGGAFNSSLAYLLTYSINTTTGAITNISLQGSTANYTTLETESLGDFVSTAVKNVDLGDSNQNQGGGFPGGDFADLSVTGVPEPTTWSCMAAGALALGVLAIRRSQRPA
jgi:hypothetical protein